MTAIAHAERAHALLSASGADRWFKCPVSPRLSAELPEPPSTEAALEGTKAHEWAEYLLNQGAVDAREFVGMSKATNPEADMPDHEMTLERAVAINIYLDAVWAALADADNTELYVENKFTYPGYDPDLGGTGDACVIHVREGILDIFDFKNGWYVVGVEGNKQLLQYALGAILKFPQYQIKTVRLNVIQPRDAINPVKRWEIGRIELFKYQQELRAAVARTKDPNAKAVPGNHCTFCPAAYWQKCETRRKAAEDTAREGFTVIKDATPGTVHPDKLAELAASLDFLEDYTATLRTLIKNELKAGRKVTGKKLVVFQERRAWAIEDAEAMAAKLKSIWPAVDAWKPRDLVSPADLEKQTGKKPFADLDKLHSLTRKTPFGEQVVDESDERPAIGARAAEGFTVIQPPVSASAFTDATVKSVADAFNIGIQRGK